jgi:hypothetical protein
LRVMILEVEKLSFPAWKETVGRLEGGKTLVIQLARSGGGDDQQH